MTMFSKQTVYVECDICKRIYEGEVSRIDKGMDFVKLHRSQVPDYDNWTIFGSIEICPDHKNVKLVIDAEEIVIK